MAKKKKVLTDNDYEEFNKWMTEYEASPTPSEVIIRHDDGSIWYQGIRGGHGDMDFVRHRLQYPALPYSIALYSDAIERCAAVADDENSELEDVINAVNNELSDVDDLTIEASLWFFMGSQFERYEDCDDEMLNCCEKSLGLFRELAKETPVVYDQYVAGVLDSMGVTLLRLQRFDDAEVRFKEALDICRNGMVRFSPIDWTYQLLVAYQHMALLYEDISEYDKAKSYIEECWNTYCSNESAPITYSFIDTMVDSVVRLYQECGENDQAVDFWRENGTSLLGRFLRDNGVEISNDESSDDLIEKKVRNIIQKLAFSSYENCCNYLDGLYAQLPDGDCAQEAFVQAIEVVKDNPWPNSAIPDANIISNNSWLDIDLGVDRLDLVFLSLAIEIELGVRIDEDLLYLEDVDDNDLNNERVDGNEVSLLAAPMLKELTAYIEWALSNNE